MAGINNNHRKRALVMLALLSIGFMAVFFRLADIMLINHDWYLLKARGQQTRKEVIPVKRGVIMDRRGHELAVNLETESIFCDPAEVISANQVARTLSSAIHKDRNDIYTKLVTNKRFSWVERKMEVEKARHIQDLRLKV